MKIKKILLNSALFLSKSNINQCLKKIKKYEKYDEKDLIQLQEKKLKELIFHSYNNIPYYKKIFKKAKILDIHKNINLENFKKIPILTKNTIRENFKDLMSQDRNLKKRKPFLNHSGGSTGSPVDFMQDNNYSDWNIANKIFYKSFANHEIGDRELRLWGSEEDLLRNKENFKIRLRNWIFNRKELNAFKMSIKDMRKYAGIFNDYKPQWVEAYVQPIYEFANFIKENNLQIHSPKGILTSAGTLYENMRELIEDVFKCKVYNRYGSREVGDMACECNKQEGLHLSVFNHYIEILDKNLKPVKEGEIGKVYVTTLNNYSMPLIRYDIGDMAIFTNKICSCNRRLPLLKKIEGREMSVFKTKEGKIIPGEFFIHFVGVVFNKGFISKFQVIQEDYNLIIIKVVIKDREKFEKSKNKINDAIRKCMGENCKIIYEEVKKIDSLDNGKYLYTISKV